MRRLSHTILATTVAVVASAAAACGGSSTTSNVVAPTATVTTDTFTGTVQPPINGSAQADVHSFNVSAPGIINVTLTAAGPPATIKVGLGLGNPNTAGTCVLLSGGSTETPAATTPQLSGQLTSSGAYCVVVFDTGNILQPITYSVTVSHT